jgi:formate/nitrite transporter FocA (FNT family)
VAIFTFLISSYEHVVANMALLSLGYFLGGNFTYGEAIYNNFIPVAIGNIIGGGIFVGALNWYIYSFGEDPINFQTASPPVSFNLRKWSFIEAWKRHRQGN